MGGKSPTSPAADDERSHIPAWWEAYFWLLSPSWDFWPEKPAPSLGNWSLPNIRALKKATNKTMIKASINALKNTIVLRSPVNKSKFFKTDVSVVRCWCGRGTSYLDGCRNFSPKKGLKWWFFIHRNQKSAVVMLPGSNHCCIWCVCL